MRPDTPNELIPEPGWRRRWLTGFAAGLVFLLAGALAGAALVVLVRGGSERLTAPAPSVRTNPAPTASPAPSPTPEVASRPTPPPVGRGQPTPPLARPGQPPATVPNPGAPGSVVQAEVAYGKDPAQRLDLYRPASAAAAPIVLFVHGGGWSGGDKAEFAWLGQHLARLGIMAVLVNYRLSPTVQHPAHAEDVADAVAWVYRHAGQHGGDPKRLYLVGHSAGAHLAALVALDFTYLAAEGIDAAVIRGVAGIAGAAYDLDAYYAQTPMAPLLVPAFGRDPSRWGQAAPLRYVGPKAPPFLLIHGLNDTSAPAVSAQRFAVALQREGVRTDLKLLPGQDHLSVLGWSTAYLPAWLGGLTG